MAGYHIGVLAPQNALRRLPDPYHVCCGMNGAVMVLPRDGLKDRDRNPLRYDSIAYISEQHYYLPRDENGDCKTYEAAGDDYSDSLEVMRGLVPTHQVFNSAVGALTGENALKAKVGETVLMVHNSCNVDSRPHLIGGTETMSARHPSPIPL